MVCFVGLVFDAKTKCICTIDHTSWLEIRGGDHFPNSVTLGIGIGTKLLYLMIGIELEHADESWMEYWCDNFVYWIKLKFFPQ